MKLTPVSYNPFDNPARRVARAEGGMTLQRTAPFPEAPEGYEFYAPSDEPAGGSSGVAPQNYILAQEGVSPGVTAGVGKMIQGVGDWIATPGNIMSGVEQVKPEIPGQWSEEDQYRQDLANAVQSHKEIEFGGQTALNLFGTSAPFVPKGTIGVAGGRPPSITNPASFNGKPFWSGAFDPLDGHILETHPYERAAQSDFHHNMYFSDRAKQAMKDGRAQFFWVDETGKVNTEWREAAANPGIVNAIESQIKIKPKIAAETPQIAKPFYSAVERAIAEAPQAKASPDHPGLIDTRLVTSKRSGEAAEPRIVDMESMRQTPQLYQSNTDLLRDYPGFEKSKNLPTETFVDNFINHIKDNLVWLHNQVPAQIRQRSKLWYDGGRRIIDDWSSKYNLPDSSVAGVIAAMSPQKDWYQNVSLAKRVLDITSNPSVKFTPEMGSKFREIPALEKYQPLLKQIRGKSLSEIDQLNLPADEKAVLKAMWVRLYDQAHNSSAFSLVTPEGKFGANVTTKDGSDARVAWGSLGEIAKAIRSIEAKGDRETLNGLMGERHKVRNFYNNLLDPNATRGDVTIDTHAVAAALLRSLSGNSLEVSHNFANYPGKNLPTAKGSAITGIQGTYPVYAEAYRRAAAEIGLLPRELQSITWEAVRGLFPDVFKNAKNAQRIYDLWRQYGQGKASIGDTRQAILEAAGGIENPTWFRPAGEADASFRRADNARKLSRPSLSGTATEARRGAGSGAPAATPSEIVRRYGIPSAPAQFAKGGAVKVTKASVNYSKGMPKSHCGICTFYHNHTCTKVQGSIDPAYWCELFKKKSRADGGSVDNNTDWESEIPNPSDVIRSIVRGVGSVGDYLGVPKGEIRNERGDVVFPTNALERGLQGADTTGQELAMSVMVGPKFTGKGIRAYHGSPYDFEKFDLSRIGTGEGAQSYGHGLYFAENPAVAANYKERLLYKSPIAVNDVPTGEKEISRLLGSAKLPALGYLSAKDALQATGWRLDDAIALLDKRAAKAAPHEVRNYEMASQHLTELRDAGNKFNPQGRMYEVNINAEPEQFLDWEKPLGQKAQAAIDPLHEAMQKEAYGRALAATSKSRADELWGMVKNPMNAPASFAQELLKKPEVTRNLSQEGIPGIRYLDQGSRYVVGGQHVLTEQKPNGKWEATIRVDRSNLGFTGPGTAFTKKQFQTKDEADAWARNEISQKGTNNYVVFDPKIVDILRKYGIAGLLPAGLGAASGQSDQRTSGGSVKLTPVGHNPFETKPAIRRAIHGN